MSEQADLDARATRLAVDLLTRCVSEPGKISPAVAAVAVKGGVIVGSAYRGELGVGDHAEFTLLGKKLADADLAGATIYTTLEPCTTRNHPKVPCAQRLIDRGVAEVVVGMLDPNPRIYEAGCGRLRAAGVGVRYFPADLRAEIMGLNARFVRQFAANPASSGTASFDYTNNDGVYTVGSGDWLFETRWSKASNTSIHLLNDPPSVDRVALAKGASDISEIRDAGVYDGSSRHRTVQEGGVAVLHNKRGYYAAVKVREVYDSTRPPDDRDELLIEYRILTDGTADFTVPESPANSDIRTRPT